MISTYTYICSYTLQILTNPAINLCLFSPLPQFIKLLTGQVDKLVKLLQTKEKLLEGSRKDLKQLQYVCVVRVGRREIKGSKALGPPLNTQQTLNQIYLCVCVSEFFYGTFKLHTPCRISHQERLMQSASTTVSFTPLSCILVSA